MSNELEPLGKVPRVRMIHGRNLGFDALAAACNVDVSNRRFGKQVGTALAEIRSYFWEETGGLPPDVSQDEWEMALARAIHARANRYLEMMPHGTLITPIALSKWWHQVVRPSVSRRRRMTASEFAQADVPRPLQNLERMLGSRDTQ